MIAAADECFLFRLLVKEIATKQGKRATFLGRPFNDRGGSGLHLNISFRRDDGSNALHDPNAPDGLAPMTRECIAGMLAHHEGIAAIAAPHANAYKRLQPDMLNGYWANWGFDDRTVCIRIPPARGEGTRIEHRMSDGAANPYLVAAAVLHAARFGVEHQMSPPEPQTPGEPPNTERRVPPTLEAALAAFEADDELCAALGPWLVETFTKLKRRRVGALREDGRRRVDHRGHAVGARLLPAVLLSRPPGVVRIGRSVPNYRASHPRRPR